MFLTYAYASYGYCCAIGCSNFCDGNTFDGLRWGNLAIKCHFFWQHHSMVHGAFGRCKPWV